MQNAGPDSPRFLRPALAGLVLTMLVAAFPAAADEPVPPTMSPVAATGLAELRAAGRVMLPDWPVWPTAMAFARRGAPDHPGPAPVGLAVRITEGMSVGAGGGFDPVSGEVIGLVALDIRF